MIMTTISISDAVTLMVVVGAVILINRVSKNMGINLFSGTEKIQKSSEEEYFTIPYLIPKKIKSVEQMWDILTEARSYYDDDPVKFYDTLRLAGWDNRYSDDILSDPHYDDEAVDFAIRILGLIQERKRK